MKIIQKLNILNNLLEPKTLRLQFAMFNLKGGEK